MQRAGWVVVTSPKMAPRHPEKVVLVRADFAQSRPDEHHALLSALFEACEFCQLAENRARVARTLAAPKYLGIREEALRRSFLGPFRFGKDRIEQLPDLHIFSGHGVNDPTPEKAAWVRDSLVQSGVLSKSDAPDQKQLASMFRLDLYEAVARQSTTALRG
jgi:ABC-type nitrate/sulfonate/bicarbonate transport system substrate-binding protein